MKFKKNITSNLILHIISILIGFFTSIFIARGLGKERQGQFSFYILIFGIIASYGHLGVTSATSYFVKRNNLKKEDVVNNNISVLILLSIIYIISIVIFRNKIFQSNIYSLILIWSIYTIAILFNNFFATLYLSEENIYIYNRFYIFANLIKGLVLALLYYTNHLQILTISILYASLEVIKNFLMIKGLKIKFKFKIDTDILRKELSYGLPLYLAALFIYLNYRVDQIMIKAFIGNSELGVYAISVHLAELAFIFPESIASAFEGRLYSCKEEEKKSLAAQIIKFAFYITLCVCIIGIMCKPLVKILYGNEYEAAGISMIILLCGIIFASVGKVTPAYFYTKGNSKIHLIVSSLVLVINIVFNLILIPRIGINGAAIASTVSYFFYGLIYVVVLRQEGIKTKQLFKIGEQDLKMIKDNFTKALKIKN